MNALLNDTRFGCLDDPTKAKILWLISETSPQRLQAWGLDENKTYVNQFKKEAALVNKQHLANLINTTLLEKSCIQ